MNSKAVRTAICCAILARERLGAAQRRREPIKVSYQPALYWALPFYVATEKNWWAEVGLKPDVLHLPGRRAADRGGGVQVMGRRRHRLGAGGAGRSALRHPDHRHHQRRIEGQRAAGAQGQGRRRSPRTRSMKGQTIAAHRQLDRATTRCSRASRSTGWPRPTCSSRTWARRRSSRRCRPTTPTWPACGRRTSTRWKRRPAPRCCARARTAARSFPARLIVRAEYAKEKPDERGQVPGRVPARAGRGPRPSPRKPRDDEEVLRAGRRVRSPTRR